MTSIKFDPKVFILSLFVALPLFISCKDNAVTEEKLPVTVEQPTLEQKKQTLQNVAPTGTMSTSTSGSGAVNPPHGQPGHDCAIPVGAPLNNAGGNTSVPAIKTTEAAPTAISGKGINPPHGQPGHRCDIKVGDPL